MKPLNGYLIIKKIESKKKGSILLPGELETEPHFAEVDVAPHGLNKIKKGDMILYRPDSDETINVDDKNLVLLHWSDVIGIMSNKNEYYDLFT